MPRFVSNPPNPWSSSLVEWLEEPPEARLEVYEEEATSVVTENDSPDVGFRWSLNPYRGCQHSCAYCLEGSTPVLMGDGSWRPIARLKVGDVVYGTVVRGRYRRYVRTPVLAHWATTKLAFRVRLEDGTEIVASGDHRFLTERGWKHVRPLPPGMGQRPALTTNNSLVGIGRLSAPPPEVEPYRSGYLCGMIRGDALLRSYSYARGGRKDEQHHFRLALVDREGLDRTRRYLLQEGVETREFLFHKATTATKALSAIRTSTRSHCARIRSLIAWPAQPGTEWRKGFLAGIFDAEGGYNGGVLRIANTDPEIVDWTEKCLRSFGFDCVVETHSRARPIHSVRIRRGLREHLRFFHTVDPAIRRKQDFAGRAVKGDAPLRVVAVEPLDAGVLMYDITTGTGDFIANGVISHNCYARPSHQYLGFGAGTDFERKIVVKVNAAEALRKTFAKPSWEGEEIAFSGNTDCYQPLEASYGLTRACLTVCAEFRNPVVVITKGLLVRRDVDVLERLAREARVAVHVSVAFADPVVSKALEPGVAAPARRFETMRALAERGIPVGVALAPVIPGLNDHEIPEVLERAKEAGASTAFMTLLRLPAEVLPVFTERLEAALPLRAGKVLSQIRDVRGGRMNDSRFGHRMSGVGPRWEAITDLFHVHARRLGLTTCGYGGDPAPTTFRRPREEGVLFDS